MAGGYKIEEISNMTEAQIAFLLLTLREIKEALNHAKC